MARPVVVDIDLGYDAILQEIEELSKTSLLVGIQEKAKTLSQSKNGRQQTPGLSVAEYAAKNEFGTNKIPERSFIRTAFDENIGQIENIAADQYGKIIDGDIAIRQGLGIIGQVITALIQRKIQEIRFPPNSPATIAMKGSSKPLIDFGQMVKSVTYAIRTRK
jgi:HK97 gp10 family phage protein